MKNNIIENIRLEMKRQKASVRTSVKVGDVLTRTLHITLSDSGDLVSLENALIAEIFIKKPDGKECYNNCVISGDEIQYTLTSQSINVPGTCTCWLMITFEDGAVVQSPEFSIVVYEPKINPNVIRSQNEYTALTAQVLKTKNYAKEAEKAVGKIGDAEANASAFAERAEAAESRVKEHADRAEIAKDEVAYNTANAMEAAETAQASEQTAQGYAEEIKKAVAGALDAENNASISAESAAVSAESAEKLVGDIQNVLAEAEKSAESAANSESGAKTYAEQTEKRCSEFEDSLSGLEEQSRIAYEHSQAIGGNPHGTTKADVGLGNADNTADMDKPVSTAQREAIEAVQSAVDSHAGASDIHTTATQKSNWEAAYSHSQLDSGNPHGVTKADVGLGNADNTADISKPVSTPQQNAIDAVYANAIAYIDMQIANLIGSADSTMDTLGEIQTAMQENQDVVEALDGAIGSRAKQTELDSHTGNSTIHTTATEKNNWSAAYEHSQSVHSIEQGGTGASTAKGAEFNLIGDMEEMETDAADSYHMVFKRVSPSESSGVLIFRQVIYLWNYIASKISTVLGLTATNYAGEAATATKWANARNINGMSVQGDANRANYGTCSTAAATAAKTVTCTGFALVTGAEITVKFTVTNTATSPTLNVNSTGAKAIYYRGSAITAGYLAANRTYTFRYNGTQWDLVGDINTDTNTDTKVTQSRSSASNFRPLLMHYLNVVEDTDPGSATNIVYYNESIEACPNTGELRATTFTGDLNGTATKAIQDADGNDITDTYVKNADIEELLDSIGYPRA